MIRYTRRVLPNQGHRLLASQSCFRRLLLKYLAKPANRSVTALEVLIVFSRVCMASTVPIARGKKMVAQHPCVAERKRHPLPIARIARRGSVTDQSNPLAVRMFYPEIAGFARRQRPDAFGAAEKRSQRRRRPSKFREQHFQIAAALQTVIHR